MEFRETTQEDLDFVANNSVSRGIQKHQPEQIDYCYTLEHEGKVLGIGGFRLINKTTAWAWTDWTHFSGSHIIVAYRVVKEWMDMFAKEHNLKRLQAYIECDFAEAIRMVKHLGFEYESTMENFMDDKDAYMYKRIF